MAMVDGKVQPKVIPAMTKKRREWAAPFGSAPPTCSD